MRRAFKQSVNTIIRIAASGLLRNFCGDLINSRSLCTWRTSFVNYAILGARARPDLNERDPFQESTCFPEKNYAGWVGDHCHSWISSKSGSDLQIHDATWRKFLMMFLRFSFRWFEHPQGYSSFLRGYSKRYWLFPILSRTQQSFALQFSLRFAEGNNRLLRGMNKKSDARARECILQILTIFICDLAEIAV